MNLFFQHLFHFVRYSPFYLVWGLILAVKTMLVKMFGLMTRRGAYGDVQKKENQVFIWHDALASKGASGGLQFGFFKVTF
jgi:hypothetical protein